MELLPSLQIHEGSMLSDELLHQVTETAKAYNERISVLVRPSIRQEEFLPAIDDGVSVIIYDPAIPPQRIRVDGNEQKSKWIGKTTSTEPRGDAPATGVVKLAIIVGKDGTVTEVDPLAGPAPLISPAVEAVRSWKYQPTLLNGRPVEIETTVEVHFPTDQ